jgi:hypothetical protein
MLSSFVQSPRPGQKHACHPNAEPDVIESVRENVHDSRPIVLTLARKRTISRWTFPHSVKKTRVNAEEDLVSIKDPPLYATGAAGK